MDKRVTFAIPGVATTPVVDVGSGLPQGGVVCPSLLAMVREIGTAPAHEIGYGVEGKDGRIQVFVYHNPCQRIIHRDGGRSIGDWPSGVQWRPCQRSQIDPTGFGACHSEHESHDAFFRCHGNPVAVAGCGEAEPQTGRQASGGERLEQGLSQLVAGDVGRSTELLTNSWRHLWSGMFSAGDRPPKCASCTCLQADTLACLVGEGGVGLGDGGRTPG